MTSAVKDYVFSLDTWRDRFPITRWLPKYRPNNIINDVIAGLTVGLTVIPQGLAYANIAKLPLVVSLAPPLPFSPSTIKRHCTPFHLVCSNYLRKITNLRTFGLKWSVEVLQENSEGKTLLLYNFVCFHLFPLNIVTTEGPVSHHVLSQLSIAHY